MKRVKVRPDSGVRVNLYALIRDAIEETVDSYMRYVILDKHPLRPGVDMEDHLENIATSVADRLADDAMSRIEEYVVFEDVYDK